MIKLFLIVIILIILICILNTKESFYSDTCSNTELNAMNSYTDSNNSKKPCIELIFDKIGAISKAFIIIKNKHLPEDEAHFILNITDNINSGDTTAPTSPTATTKNNSVVEKNRDGKQIIQLTQGIEYLQLGNTYLITLKIKKIDNDNYITYDTLEITFKDVKLAENNIKQNCNNIFQILKNKQLILSI